MRALFLMVALTCGTSFFATGAMRSASEPSEPCESASIDRRLWVRARVADAPVTLLVPPSSHRSHVVERALDRQTWTLGRFRVAHVGGRGLNEGPAVQRAASKRPRAGRRTVAAWQCLERDSCTSPLIATTCRICPTVSTVYCHSYVRMEISVGCFSVQRAPISAARTRS